MFEFKVWWPEEGGTIEDAVVIMQLTPSYRHAAEAAGQYDYDQRSGWQRGGNAEQVMMVQEVTADGQKIGVPRRFSVTREVAPRFTAEEQDGAL